MLKKSTAIALASALLLSSIPGIAAEAEKTVNYSISGYVSTAENGGFILAGEGKTPVIHMDENDHASVIRAVGDLADDMEAVTGIAPAVSSDDITVAADTSGISIEGGVMTVSLASPVQDGAQCFVAVYDKNGVLAGIEKASEAYSTENNVTGFGFDKALEKPEGGEIKAFVWTEDMEPLTEAMGMRNDGAVALEGVDVVIGTIGMSETIDALADSGALDTDEIEGKWESFTIQNIDDTLVIAGSDKRGTIYGIYDLCEKMGVSPWSWWADAEPVHADALYINLPEGGYTEGEPSVKYRGIFINDEYNMNQWSKSLSSDGTAMSHEMYEKVFELLLRLKANYLWPAMHAYSPAFHSDEENARLAAEYGIVMGSSHCEPLLRNNLGELDEFQARWEAENGDKTLYKALENESGNPVAYYWTDHDNNGNHVDNKEFLEAYWRESVQKYGGYENVYSLGMRGVHDGSFQTNMDYATALNEIIACQRKILQEEVADKQGIALEDIPQVFIPYKDVLSYYNDGSLKIPEDVTIMWTDDNYGYVRQNANDTERANPGRTGIYYHVSYYGYPTSYLWLSTTQPGLIREEMGKSYDMGADKMWILNVGDLKPAERDIEYFLKLARNIDVRDEDIDDVFAAMAQRDFNMNDDDARKYAEIMDEYYELANSKRPDFFRTDDASSALDISLTAYGDEAERYLERYKNICAEAEALYAALPESKQAAFFELALYPIRSAKNMAVNYVQTERAELYAEQGRGAAANRYAAEAASAVDSINEDINTYNTMLGGKWNNMTNINPSRLQGCDAHITLDLNAPTVSSLDYTELAVMTDSQTEYSDEPSMTVSAYDSYDKFIDVINRGYGSLDYEISTTSDALVFDKDSGTAYGSDRVRVRVDGGKAAEGTSQATVTVSQILNGEIIDSKDIAVTIENPMVPADEKTYIEAGGVVSVETEHYSNTGTNGEHAWQLEKDFGRSGDSMKVYPELSDTIEEADIKSSSAYLEYNVYFTNTGEYTLELYRMPTLDERGTARVAVALDDGDPTVLRGTSEYTGSRSKTDAWSHGVLTNIEKLGTTVEVSEPGMHTLRIYSVSPSVVIDKAVLSLDDVYSYFGAPESYNTTYNTSRLKTETTVETAPSEDITKTYEPKVVIGGLENNGNIISGIKLHRIDSSLESAVVIAAGYDAAGNVTSAALEKAEFTGDTADIDIDLALPENTAGYAVYAVDSLMSMMPIAPYKTYGTIASEAFDDYDSIKADLSDSYGRKSIALIADCEITEDLTADHIKYIYGEELWQNSYKFIPALEPGEYFVCVGIDGAETVNDELNTIVRITPDDPDGETVSLGEWTFDDGLADSTGQNAFTLGGAASLANGQIKMNDGSSTGSAVMTFPAPVTVPQGETSEIEFDITFGKLINKTMSFDITDGNGTSLVSAQIYAYNISENTNVKIGGVDVLEDSSILSNAISRGQNTAAQNSPTHFRIVLDFTTSRATVYIGYDGGSTVELTGRLGENSGSISGMSFTTSYNNNDRACYVDNVSAGLVSGPLYYMTFEAVDANTNSSVDGAVITVTDGTTGAVIEKESDGRYHLCEGDYVIHAEADGYRAVDMPLELIPALDRKDISVPMVSNADLVPASVTIRYVDEEGNSVKDDTVITEDVYVEDSYTVTEEYTADFTKRSDSGKFDFYAFNASASQTTAILTENAVFTLVFNLKGQYDYHEDFEAYEINDDEWEHGSGNHSMTLGSDNSTYLNYACASGSSVGSYTTFNEISCEGKTVKVEADLRFSPKNITGDSQFSIGNTSPSFSSNRISYGFENSAGHIIGLVHKANSSSFLVNGQSVSTDLIGDWVHMEADIDFLSKKVTVRLTNDSGYDVTVADADFYSSSVEDNIGSFYMRGAGGGGNVSLDNLTIMITGDGVPAEPEIISPLNYKTVYAFGDSIVRGHNDPNNAFMNVIARDYAVQLNKMAVNGATMIKSDNWITDQVLDAPDAQPDFVVFDGYTNDAYGDPSTDSFNTSNAADITQIMGEVQGSGATKFDNTTFCGAFEELIYTMKQKWPDAKLVFVTIHKSGARDFALQELLVEKTLEICAEWGVTVVDMFNDCELDTRNADEMAQYIIDGRGSHPNIECVKTYYEPAVVSVLEGLCETGDL